MPREIKPNGHLPVVVEVRGSRADKTVYVHAMPLRHRHLSREYPWGMFDTCDVHPQRAWADAKRYAQELAEKLGGRWVMN